MHLDLCCSEMNDAALITFWFIEFKYLSEKAKPLCLNFLKKSKVTLQI